MPMTPPDGDGASSMPEGLLCRVQGGPRAPQVRVEVPGRGETRWASLEANIATTAHAGWDALAAG
eukprot:15145694-Alexandrium_andersonii.AAC.1